MTPCVWRILCLLNSRSVPYFRQPPNLPTAARRNWKCTECGTTAFGRNRMSAESAHLSTFGAETETEAEIRSTSNLQYLLIIFNKLLSLVHFGTEMNWLGFGVKRSKVTLFCHWVQLLVILWLLLLCCRCLCMMSGVQQVILPLQVCQLVPIGHSFIGFNS